MQMDTRIRGYDNQRGLSSYKSCYKNVLTIMEEITMWLPEISSVWKRLFWIGVVVLSLPVVAYAADYILNSGEFVGLGSGNGRLLFTEQGAIDEIAFLDTNVGINLTASPGQRLHIGDGNLLIEGGGETAVKIKRDVTYTSTVSGLSQNPIFEIGRIIQAGDGDPELRFLYTDDNTAERSVFELDRKGIAASVKTDRGSHFEGFISTTDAEPIFRLNSYPKMRLEMGNGGTTPVDVAIQREMTGTLTILTHDIERVRVDATGIAVHDGYVQLDTNAGMPPAPDCDAADEVGRMKVDAVNPILYICTAVGWRQTILGTFDNYLPSIQN